MSKLLWKYCSAYAPVVLWAAMIFFFSSRSSPKASDIFFVDYVVKKLGHMIIYGIFYGLLFRAINIDKMGKLATTNSRKNWALPFLLTFIYGTSDELHQMFTPTRTPHPLDVSFDMIGAGIAFLQLHHYI